MMPEPTKAKTPDTTTKPYRVCIAGALYNQPRVIEQFDGTTQTISVTLLATRGERIELTDREAHRLVELDAVKPADEPLSYDEMDDKQLDVAVKAAGVRVISSGADQDRPLRTDKINALRTFDQGRGVAG